MQRKIKRAVIYGDDTMSHDDAFGSKSGTTVPGGPDSTGGERAAMRDWDQGPESQHIAGMDVAKPADQQQRVALKKGMQDGTGSFGGYGHPKFNFTSNGVDLYKYIELFLFLLFITLFGNTLFM